MPMLSRKPQGNFSCGVFYFSKHPLLLAKLKITAFNLRIFPVRAT
jgi:hypothetical protein